MERQRCDTLRRWTMTELELPGWNWHWTVCSSRIAKGRATRLRCGWSGAALVPVRFVLSVDGTAIERRRDGRSTALGGDVVTHRRDRPRWSERPTATE